MTTKTDQTEQTALELAEDSAGFTALDLADECGCRVQWASYVLLGLYQSGLISRTRAAKGTGGLQYVYHGKRETRQRPQTPGPHGPIGGLFDPLWWCVE